MPRGRHPPSIAPPEESESEQEEEEEEVEEERVDADAGNRKETAVESGEESEDEEDSSQKTTSQMRGLDYGSDDDSGKTFPSPSASAFIVKHNSKPETNLKKRPAESEPTKERSEVKKAKKVKKGNGEVDAAAGDKGRRSSGSQRIWYPEDELVILTGVLEYKSKTGVDYNSNFDAFHKYIKGSLIANVDKSQLVGKIKKLKEKYRLNARKEADGEAPVFLKDHEKEVYEHSKKVWGGKVVSLGPQGAKSKPRSKKEVNVISKAPILKIDNVLALPVPEIEASKKEAVGGSTKEASRVRKAVKKMGSGEAAVEMKDYAIPMPPAADNSMAEKGIELVEKSKVDEVVGGSTKAASRVRKALKKMDSGEAAVEMKDYAIPMPPMADNLMAEKGVELVEKSKVDEVVGGSKAASRVRKALKKMDSGEAAVEMNDYAIPTPPMADNLIAEKGIGLVEKSKVDEVVSGSTKAASRVRKAVKKMDSGEAAVEMKDYAIPMPPIADNLMAEKGIVLVEKSKVDEVVSGSSKAASRVRKAVKKMDSGEAAVEMKDYAIPPIADNLMAEKGLELVEKSKVDAFNEKWTRYQMDAAQLYVRRLDLVIEHTKIILDALQSQP